ncbi:hypothetical protein TSAR_017054 [Trichomalopsis sarcophagae]|uniref:MD-2-related lipid-recognition domain-containing protein n=1 Tax=Trichomalopsis sarcophagae TaxID=543379 RepID=A0A232FHA2_9HYME|nr:hypothetical protein TSAR_017054 [Trichomalopsis sarcophagae]
MFKYHYTLLVSLFYCMSKIHGGKCDEQRRLMELEDIIVDYFNTTYFDEDTFDISVIYNADSDNTMRIKFDIIHELPSEIFLKMKVWGRAFGQYQVPTGISVDINVCDNQLKKYFLEQILQTIGITDCPPKKVSGVYEFEGISPNINGLPLYALPGLHLLVDSEVYSTNISLMKVKAYMNID